MNDVHGSDVQLPTAGNDEPTWPERSAFVHDKVDHRRGMFVVDSGGKLLRPPGVEIGVHPTYTDPFELRASEDQTKPPCTLPFHHLCRNHNTRVASVYLIRRRSDHPPRTSC